tara:strand:+ start:5812 stop:6084 length:273 start_codon:yes stop_codon:yes gene_type:complete
MLPAIIGAYISISWVVVSTPLLYSCLVSYVAWSFYKPFLIDEVGSFLKQVEKGKAWIHDFPIIGKLLFFALPFDIAFIIIGYITIFLFII